LLNAYPWTAGGRTLEFKHLSALIGAVEMVRKGCTACYDLVAEIPAPSADGIEAVARAYDDVGMRAVVAHAMPPPLRERAEAIRLQPYKASLATCRQLLTKGSWDRDRLRPALGPTIPHHCSDEFIIGCGDLAKEHGIGVQMHAAESKVQAVVGMRPTAPHSSPICTSLGYWRRTSLPRTRSGSTTTTSAGLLTPVPR
jgi:5-methylthioadenosine/S-adenosylhomocysteine deaminase